MENSFFLPLPEIQGCRFLAQWCDWAFKKSVDFLESFGFMGWDYYKASVIICVFIVIIIYAVLALLLIL